jgi:hypothetical protein
MMIRHFDKIPARAAVLCGVTLGLTAGLLSASKVRAEDAANALMDDTDFGNKSLDPASYPSFKFVTSECNTDMDDVPGSAFYGRMPIHAEQRGLRIRPIESSESLLH